MGNFKDIQQRHGRDSWKDAIFIIAAVLLTEAERQIAEDGFDVAWLAVVRGNDRAQAFYRRQGWVDEGDLDYPVTALGETFISPCRRFTKQLV